MSSSVLSPFDLLPNETIIEIFKHLNAQTILSVMKVCRNWNQLGNFNILWKRLCYHTGRIIGSYTFFVTKLYASNRGWKRCYFWITSKDMLDSEEEIKKAGNQIEGDALKKRYIFARGLDLFPESPEMLQIYADFLVERSDSETNSWKEAEQMYQTSIEFAKRETSQDTSIKSLIYCLYRYTIFLTANRRNYPLALRYFKQLLKRLPRNVWIFEKYAEFLSDYCHKYNQSDKVYRSIIRVNGNTGSALSSYATFLWQVKRHYELATKCFGVACEMDIERLYCYANFLGRQLKDEVVAKTIIYSSKLYKYVEENPDDATATFCLALSFHQIHCTEEAERLYRRHISMSEQPNVCTLCNLAELLVHSRFEFREAENLYQQGLELSCYANETIEVALAGLHLAQNKRDEGLVELKKLLQSSHIQAARNTLTEGWILYYIHCYPNEKEETLYMIKKQLVTEGVRPKLILMFDANLKWAEQFCSQEEYYWMSKLSAVYNCEENVEELDQWDKWRSISVDPLYVDEEEDNINYTHLLWGFNSDEISDEI